LIPIKDNIESNTKPIVNYSLIIANIIVFIYQLTLSIPEIKDVIYTYGFIPKVFRFNLKNNLFELATYKQLITHMFLHGNLVHIFSNLWFLYIFGDNVEDRLGHIRYMFFYLLSGIGACLTQYVFDTNSSIPMIGASGAISGVLGGYVVLYPYAKVLTIIPVFLFIPLPIPALIFIFLWFIFQIINALTSLVIPYSNVAWIAHIAGFLIGYKYVKSFVNKKDKVYYI